MTITDNMDGTLKVTSTPLVFTNFYSLRKDITLTAHKELQGRTLQPEEFSFEVRRSGAAAGSAPIATGKNDADGNIIFTPEITLTERDLAAISPTTGIGEVKFLISEVQGTDPTVVYMTTPAEAEVKLALKQDGTLLAAMPGQEIKHTEATCPSCGGTGTAHGLNAIYIDASARPMVYIGNPFELEGALDSTGVDVCQACGGSGYDPDHPGESCTACNGNGVNLGTEPIELTNGDVLIPTGEHVPVNMVGTIGLEYDFISSTSAWVVACSVIHANEGTGASDLMALIYYGSGTGECTVCHGTGTAEGEPYVYGEPEPVSLVNHLKAEIRFTAEKLMDGKPAAESFEFVLLETDELRRTETEIARTKNGTDGKILFENVYVDPVPAGDRYYVIREAAGTNPAVEYDTGEDLYKVTVASSPDGIHTLEQKLMSGDGVFRNTRKAGSLAIEVKTSGYTRPWWATYWETPKFKVNVLLKDREGKPLAGHPLPETKGKARLSAKAENTGNIKTVSDVRVRAESPAQNLTDSDGHGTLLIEGGSTAVITGLPDGATYEVSQPADSMPRGFSQGSAEGATGTIRGGEQSKATLQNNYEGEEEPDPSESPKTTDAPTVTPTATPTATPATAPTVTPTVTPTATSTVTPAATPTTTPTSTPTAAPTITPKPQEVPRTGDSASPLLWAGLILAGLIGIVLLMKPRKKE